MALARPSHSPALRAAKPVTRNSTGNVPARVDRRSIRPITGVILALIACTAGTIVAAFSDRQHRGASRYERAAPVVPPPFIPEFPPARNPVIPEPSSPTPAPRLSPRIGPTRVIQPPLIVGAGEQAGIALKLIEQEFNKPVVGLPFAGSFAVRNVGPPYRVEQGISGPQFGILIYRGDELLYRKYGSWGRQQSQTQIMQIQWSTERLGKDGYSTPFLVVPGPGVYRCRIELFAGSERQRLLDSWESTETVP